MSTTTEVVMAMEPETVFASNFCPGGREAHRIFKRTLTGVEVSVIVDGASKFIECSVETLKDYPVASLTVHHRPISAATLLMTPHSEPSQPVSQAGYRGSRYDVYGSDPDVYVPGAK